MPPPARPLRRRSEAGGAAIDRRPVRGPSPGAAIRRRAGTAARAFLSRYGLLIGFVALWQLSSTQGWVNPAVFPPLDAIAAALWKGLASGALIDDIAISLQRSGIAFAAAVALGTPLGLFMGQIRSVARALDPILQLFRQTSTLALYPVFILLLGLGETSKVFLSNGINDQVQSIFCVLEGSPIRRIEDIAGKTVAVNTLGAHLDYTVREALHGKGLPQDAANLVTVPGPQLEQVLRPGQVDVSAFGYWQTTFEGAARRNGGLRAVFDDTDVLGEIAGGFIVLRRDRVDAHPAEAKAFVEASARALDHARENPDETRAIFARVLEQRGENPEVAQFFKGYGVRQGGVAVERDLQFWIDVLEREGRIEPGKLKAEDILFAPARTVAAK